MLCTIEKRHYNDSPTNTKVLTCTRIAQDLGKIAADPPAILAFVHAAIPTSTCMASASLGLRLRTRLILELTFRLRLRRRLRLELRLGWGVVGSVLVATPGSVHSTVIELQLLIIPQHHIHIPPRPLLFRRFGLSVLVATPGSVHGTFFELQLRGGGLGLSGGRPQTAGMGAPTESNAHTEANGGILWACPCHHECMARAPFMPHFTQAAIFP